MSPVPVPPEFQEIGYSGEFWMDAVIGEGVDVDVLRAQCPYLLGNTGWMGLAVVEHPEGLSLRVVRRDADAVREALIRRGQR